jgi:hypothetical protein
MTKKRSLAEITKDEKASSFFDNPNEKKRKKTDINMLLADDDENEGDSTTPSKPAKKGLITQFFGKK